MRPPVPRSSMARAAACMPCSVPMTLTDSIRSISTGGVSITGAISETPGVVHPHVEPTEVRDRGIDEELGRVRHRRRRRTPARRVGPSRGPRPPSPPRRSRRAASRAPDRDRGPPSANAIPAPSPRPPPVTTATCSSRPLIASPAIRTGRGGGRRAGAGARDATAAPSSPGASTASITPSGLQAVARSVGPGSAIAWWWIEFTCVAPASASAAWVPGVGVDRVHRLVLARFVPVPGDPGGREILDERARHRDRDRLRAPADAEDRAARGCGTRGPPRGRPRRGPGRSP